MNLLEIIRRHRETRSSCERSESSESKATLSEVNSLNSLISHPKKAAPSEVISLNSLISHPTQTQGDHCADWLYRYIRGRYPKLADVKAAALRKGFAPPDIEQAMASGTFVVYRSFPRRYIGEVELVRTVDDWPDDPPLLNR